MNPSSYSKLWYLSLRQKYFYWNKQLHEIFDVFVFEAEWLRVKMILSLVRLWGINTKTGFFDQQDF